MKRAQAHTLVFATLAFGAVASLFFQNAAAGQQVAFEKVGSFPAPSGADIIRVQGDYAYVGGDKTLTIFDVSNPKAPVRRGSYTFPDQLWGFRILGSRAYVGANFFGMGILDISDPDSPKLVGSFTSIGQSKVGDAFGSKAVFIDHMEGVVMVDISKEAKPTLMSSYFLDGYARDLLVRGSMAYAVDQPTGLYVFDLSKPGPLKPVGTFHGGDAPDAIEAGPAQDGRGPNVLAGIAHGKLQIYDVSDPAAPVLAASFGSYARWAKGIALHGERVYVAAEKDGIQVVDVSTPSKPGLVGAFKTPAPARDVAVTNSLVFVIVRGTNEGTVLILRETP